MITKLLSTAVKFYLRSQVSRVEDLEVKITGKNRQILQGYIPKVFLSCHRGIYQGLHLREVGINGANIAINLPEVLKNKPLRLLEPIVVDLKLSLSEEDLMASIDSALLQSGLADLWQIILSRLPIASTDSQLITSSIKWHKIAIAPQQLDLSGTYQDDTGDSNDLNVSTGITLSNSHTLSLFPLKISHNLNIIDAPLEKLEIDLGTDVEIEKLVMEFKQILCLGKITINN